MARKRRGAPKRAPRPAAPHRELLNTTGELLKLIFGHFAESHPALWELQAFLAIVASVFERLTSTKDPLPLDELADLTKILADARRNRSPADRAALRAIPGAPQLAPPDHHPDDAPLPRNISRAIHRIYGARVPDGSTDDHPTTDRIIDVPPHPPKWIDDDLQPSNTEMNPSNAEPNPPNVDPNRPNVEPSPSNADPNRQNDELNPSNAEPVASVNETPWSNDKSELLTDESERTFDSPELPTEPPEPSPPTRLNRQSAIPIPQSAIRNPQSEIPPPPVLTF